MFSVYMVNEWRRCSAEIQQTTKTQTLHDLSWLWGNDGSLKCKKGNHRWLWEVACGLPLSLQWRLFFLNLNYTKFHYTIYNAAH
jgi:hypothetical protein